MLNKNKKAQVADSVTWIVATIVIIVLLVLFIFGASMLGSTRVVKGEFRESLLSKSYADKTDLFLVKSLITYYQLDEAGKKYLGKELKILDDKNYFEVNYTIKNQEFAGRLV
jgi:hypothetical protein